MNLVKTSGLAMAGVIASLFMVTGSASAQAQYSAGASATEIKIGNTMPYSGPASGYGVLGKALAAYFKKVNAEGGINGRKINFISYDDAYSPPKTFEQTRRLVESDEVLAVFHSLGTPTNAAVHKYLNTKKVPHLFVGSASTNWANPTQFPWTIGWQPNYESEGKIYAKYILKEHPNAKVGVLYQNDDFGKELLSRLRQGLGSKADMIVAEESYETSSPTIDSQIVTLRSKKVDVLVSFATSKFAAQSIKKSAELGWKPLIIVPNISTSVSAVVKPAGLENAQGVVSATFMKDPDDPQWQDDAGIKAFDAFLKDHYPEGNRSDNLIMLGYNAAQTLVHVLTKAGDNLTHENVMKEASNIQNLELEGLLPGIQINTSPSNFAPIADLQLVRFEGERWKRFGDVVSARDNE